MTPGCTVCGFVVEWVRTPYISRWRLFDNPAIETRGRYVVAPPGTPHYPGLHPYGSRNWVDDEYDPEPELGEVTGAREKGTVFGLPAPYSRAVLVGSATCVERGDHWPLPVIARTVVGWDSRCYPPIPSPPPEPTIDVSNCHDQQRLALILELLYQGDGLAAETEFLAWFPGAVVARVPNSASAIPGSLVCTFGSQTLVVVSGSTNFLQWALQGIYGLTGQTNVGFYSTLPLWEQAADAMIARVFASPSVPTGRIYLAGHSYGGAVCNILAARYRVGQPGRYIGLFTIGSPKPGDFRLRDLAALTDQYQFVNDQDPVPHLPPSGGEFRLYDWIITALERTRWLGYTRPSVQIGLGPNGERRQAPTAEDVYQLVALILIQHLYGQFPDVIFAHLPSEYRRRLVCPGEPAPSPTPPYPLLWLRPDEIVGYDLGANIDTWIPAPPTTRTGFGDPLFYRPTLVENPTNGIRGGLFNVRTPLTIDQASLFFDRITLPGDWTCYAVGQTRGGGAHGPLVYDQAGADVLLAVSEAGVYASYQGDTTVSGGAPPVIGQTAVWSSVRAGDQWILRRNRVVIATATGPTGPVTVNAWSAFYGSPPAGFCWAPEVIVLDHAAGVEEDDGWWTNLLGRYVEDPDMPAPGTVIDWAGNGTPVGYLPCDGAAVSRTTYAALWEAIGTLWGAGNGSTTFNVPDLRGRALIGAGTGSGLTPRSVGQTGGAENVVITMDYLTPHTHAINQRASYTPDSDPTSLALGDGSNDENFSGDTSSTGSGDPLPIMNPFGVVRKFIKV